MEGIYSRSKGVMVKICYSVFTGSYRVGTRSRVQWKGVAATSSLVGELKPEIPSITTNQKHAILVPICSILPVHPAYSDTSNWRA
jgi:hypothetical protein